MTIPTLLLALNIGCLFQAIIWIIVVAILVALIQWVIGYLGLPFPPLVLKLLVVLAVVICVWILVSCLAYGSPFYLGPR